MSFFAKMVRSNLAILMLVKLQNLVSCKHKLVLLTMQVQRYGRINLMMPNATFGL